MGIHAAKVARAAGAQVVGFDRHQATLDAATELGLDARPADDTSAETDLVVKASGGGVDVVIDTVGRDDTIEQADRLVRPGGRIVGVGYSPTSAYRVASTRLVLGEIQVVGSRYAHRDDLEHAVAMVAARAPRPIVGMVRPLEAVNEIFDALAADDVVGRAVLDVAGVTEGNLP